MMNASRLFALVAIFALAATALFPHAAAAKEELDNDKLIELIKGEQSLKVILADIQADPKACKFTSGYKDKIALSKACKEAKWEQEQIDTLQLKVLELAAQGLKDLKNLVNLFLASVENADDQENPQQYEELMHKIIRAGSSIVPYLRDNLTQESDRKRKGILEALARIGDRSPDLLKELVLMLDDSSKPVRAQAAKTVAALSGSETGPSLIAMLNRRDKKNDAVALTLGYMRFEPAIESLVTMLKVSRDSDDRVCAAFALGEMRAKTFGASDTLLLGILDDKDEKLREVCAKAAALIGDKRTPLYITKAFDRYRQGRRGILDVLGNFKSVYAARFLANQLEDNEDNEIRKIAMKTLELMTNEHYETKEQWLSFIELLALRPEWQEQNDKGKLPDVQDAK